MTVEIPAFITCRLHIAQDEVPEISSPVLGSTDAIYSVEPIISSRDAEIIAFASAWIERHISYLSPRGMFSLSLRQKPRSQQFFLPLGAPL